VSRSSQSQKMRSIGQLAAGIAHEINTPTQYVGDNIRFLKDAFEDIIDSIAYHRCPLQTNPIRLVPIVVYAANALDHKLSAGPTEEPAAPVETVVLRHLNIVDRFAEWEQSCRRLRQEADRRAT
jgi:hypothetical protein